MRLVNKDFLFLNVDGLLDHLFESSSPLPIFCPSSFRPLYLTNIIHHLLSINSRNHSKNPSVPSEFCLIISPSVHSLLRLFFLFSHLDLVIEIFFSTLYRGNGVMPLWPSEKCGLWSLNHVAALPRDARALF